MQHTKKSAFTLLEVIFVIMILGIVASISSQAIAQIYENYIMQRATHKASIKTELAATQIVNRLAYSIPGTVIARKDATTFEALSDVPIGTTDHIIMEWIGYDIDGFTAITSTTNTGRKPLWSGYCDVDASAKDAINTPGSRLSLLNQLLVYIRPLGSPTNISDTAIIFPIAGSIAHHVGFSETVPSTAAIHPVLSNTGDETLNLDVKANRTIKEHYKLAWTAYAIEPINKHVMPGTTGDVWDLKLWYDYQPWDGEVYTQGASQILIHNVSVFKLTGTGDSIRLKLCQRENIGENYTTTICKEKAVIR